MTSLDDLIARVEGWHERTAAAIPQLSRGKVWCTTCGAERSVNGGHALRHGWPKCCGYTMTIDSPDERAAILKAKKAEGGV